MTSVSFIPISEYKATLQEDVGSLMFAGHLYDCEYNVDKTKLRKDFKEELKGKRIHAVLIYTEESPKFSKTTNCQITYRNPTVAMKGQEGAFQRDSVNPQIAQMWWSYHPMGDAIVVYIEPKPKEIKVEGVPTKYELKKLRKEWKELEENFDEWNKEHRPRIYDEDHSNTVSIKWKDYDVKKQPLVDDLLPRLEVFMKYDTPFIRRKMSDWARYEAGVEWKDNKWQKISNGSVIEYSDEEN